MIKEIWNTLTLGGKRALSLSVTGFTLYALSGIAMMYIVLKSLEAVMSGSSVLLWYWIALAACLLIKGGSNILADVKKHHAGFDIVFQITVLGGISSKIKLETKRPTIKQIFNLGGTRE